MTEFALPLDEPLSWLIDSQAPEVHLEIIGRPQFVVPVLGSGISRPLGYPTGAELALELSQMGTDAGVPQGDLDFRDPRTVADLLIKRGTLSRDDILSRVAEIYAQDPQGTSDTIDALLRIQSARLVTLNYDRSIEVRAAELDVPLESLVLARDGARVLEVLAADADRDKLVVIHAHGIATDDPSSIVLDQDGYSDLINASHVEDCLRTLMHSNRLLFMGTQLDELHIAHELVRLRFLRKHHLLVATKETAGELRTDPHSPFLQERNFVLIRGYPDHSELVPLVRLLGPPPEGEGVPPAPRGPQFPTVGAKPPADYVETLLVEQRDPQDDDFRASYLMALGLREALPIERVAPVGTRTLIVGLPGSGKSTLLLEIGSRQPQSVVPLRLSALRLDLVGEPQLLLPRWLETAEAFREGEVRDSARVERETFHFLIDGLDEVPYPVQRRAAEALVAVAATFPEHTFTVASRAIPALEVFGRAEWVRVALAPTPNWRDAYLEQRGVKWGELANAAPLLQDLRGLLDLPFFLSHTVDLYEAGALAEAGDMLSLVSTFVDAALQDAERTLPKSAVRKWLRALALGMLLAGRTDVTVDEIASSLSEELAAYGDAEAVAERLVSARLLRGGDDQRFAFVHRIFGEALAAEALNDVEPDESGVLDVAAPVVTERIRGLRGDWLVPMTLVASTSARWRRALAERDPLAAARATPTDGPVEEREEAARLIWNQYSEWRIWISDYRRMTIVEDESVLARLLASGGLEELHAEIRNAVSSDVRETVGNAIKVLATLGDRSIESQLRQILETNDDYVLRRMAGIAARDLGLDALFFVIAHRAIHPADSTEAQDLTYAAVDLATSVDLLAFAERAARKGGEAIGILGHAIQSRLTARQELDVLRAWAAHPTEPLPSERERIIELLPRLPLEDEQVAESVIFVAGSWRAQGDDLKELLRHHPGPGAKAVVALVASKAAFPFELSWMLAELDAEPLAAAGATKELLDYKAMVDDWAKKKAE